MLRKLTLSSICLLALGTANADAKSTLRFASFVPPSGHTVKHIFDPWIKQVEAAAGGDLDIQGFWGGALGRSPFQQYKLLQDGVIDITLILDKYTQGQFPDDAIVELPYLIRNGVEGSTARWRMFEQGLLRGYDDIKTVSAYTSELIGIHTSKPFKTLDDLKGMKIRAGGVAGTLLLKHIGAAPVGVPTPQLAESLERGVIDGVMLNWAATRSFRTNNVTSYHYSGPLGVHSFIIAMNKKKWDGLSAKAKAAVDKFGGLHFGLMAAKVYEEDGKKVIDELDADAKHTVIKESEAEIAKRRAFFKPVYDAWIKDTPDGAKKLKALEDILAEIRKRS